MATTPTAAATSPVSLVTSWLPVTTAWSAPAACSSLVWEGYPPWLAVNDPGYGIYVDRDISCLPPAATKWWEQPKDLTSSNAIIPLTTYLLGPITCPQAYTTATTSVQDSSTFITCCPSDYLSIRSRQMAMLGNARHRLLLVAPAWVTTASTVTSSAIVNGIQMNGWNIAAQTSSSHTSPASRSASITSSASAGAKTTDGTQTSTSANKINDTTTNLNTKEKIGIGIGVSLGIIAIVALVLGAFWYGRRKRGAIDTPYSPVTAIHDQRYEYYGAAPKAPAALPVQEMHSGFHGHEMEGTHPVSELYGNDPLNR